MLRISKVIRNILTGLPRTLLRDLLARKIRDAGAKLPIKAINAFADHILADAKHDFQWDDGQKDKKNIEISFTEEDLDEIKSVIQRVIEKTPDITLKAVKKTSSHLFQQISDEWIAGELIRQAEIEDFRARIEDLWGEGLSYLRLLHICCQEYGEETWWKNKRSKSQTHKFRHSVLGRLHARGCQVTGEIICLLENGFADGAMARWRTLNEILVVAILISSNDEELAERYLLHDAIEEKQQIEKYQLIEVPVGAKPLPKRMRQKVDRKYKAVLKRFGPEFAQQFGWASKHLKQQLGHKKPTFKDLQAAAGRSNFGSHYKIASFSVHAGARSLFFNYSSMMYEGVVMAGRSNAGLSEPAEITAQSLLHLTSLHAGEENSLDRIIERNIKIESLLKIKDKMSSCLSDTDQNLTRSEVNRRRKLAERRSKRVARRSKIITDNKAKI